MVGAFYAARRRPTTGTGQPESSAIGGIATAGAPGGDKDEARAIAGLDKIKDRLN